MIQSINQRIKSVRMQRSEKTRKMLLDKLKKASQILVDKFHVKKVILIGSLNNKSNIHPFSDIDLIVEGLGNNYLKAGGYLIDHIGDCIELKPFEMLDEDFKDYVLLTGKVIYTSDD